MIRARPVVMAYTQRRCQLRPIHGEATTNETMGSPAQNKAGNNLSTGVGVSFNRTYTTAPMPPNKESMPQRKNGAASDFMTSMGQAEQEKRDWKQDEV